MENSSDIKSITVIKSGCYEDLPLQLQQNINRVKEKVKRPIQYIRISNLEQKIRDILG